LTVIKHSGTVDGLREAMRLLAPHLKLLQEGDEQQVIIFSLFSFRFIMYFMQQNSCKNRGKVSIF